MDRDVLRAAVRERLADRRLIYFGTRGDDAEGLADLPELSHVFSVVAPLRHRSGVRSLALEALTGVRVDLDVHDIDGDDRDEVRMIRQEMLRAFAAASVVVTYRPSRLVSSVCFARQDHTQYAGLFRDHQIAFEYKPWVETSIRSLGIPCIPWRYVADEDQIETLRLLDDGPVVLRTSRSSGGTGLALLTDPNELDLRWPEQAEAFVSVAPYLERAVPTNVSAVVWEEGVTVHDPSVQLIGIPGLTARTFGYCGNDFGAVLDLDPSALNRMDRFTREIGRWLHHHGYRGAFGVDYLITGTEVLFTEVNPRFQGVTHLSCYRAARAGEGCVMLEHLAALLGVAAPDDDPLDQRLGSIPNMAHMVLHHLDVDPGPSKWPGIEGQVWDWPELVRCDVVATPELTLDPGATVARVSINARVTTDGHTLDEPWVSRLAELENGACR